MAEKLLEPVAYSRLGQVGARTPLVIAVPHAGRHYPRALLAAARLPLEALETIEDRHADLLVADAVHAGAVAIVARMARAFVDLNRDEREIDPAILARRRRPARCCRRPRSAAGWASCRAGSRRAARCGGARSRQDAIEARLALAHRPYHAAIDAALDEALRARRGRCCSIAIRCPRSPARRRGVGPQIVIGDRHGRSAAARFVGGAARAARAAGPARGAQQPLCGRPHARSARSAQSAGVHAMQIEIDRALYLDETQRDPGPGLADGAADAGIDRGRADRRGGRPRDRGGVTGTKKPPRA